MSEGIAPGIDRKRRVSLVHAPTRLEPLRGLSKLLGGPEIWIKRDDCTGLALGGNKARKLEFILAEARGADADTLLTVGASQSNHVRMTAAAARVIGMGSISLMFPEASIDDAARGRAPAGNLLLDQILGSRIELLPFAFDASTPEKIDAFVEARMSGLRGEGRKPFYIPAGGATPLGALGYFRATEELAVQARREGCRIDTLILPFGTGGTLAGVLLGVDALRLDWSVKAVSVAGEGAWEKGGIAPYRTIAREAAALLGLEFRLDEERCEVLYGYVGPGYAVTTAECAEAIRMTARADGILLDPVYTGKAMAGLIDLIRNGRIGKGQTVVFLHTGGAPALFAHPEVLTL